MIVRGGRWASLNRWFAQMERRPTYLGTRSDYHQHVHDLPPQLGGCCANGSKAQKAAAREINMLDIPVEDGFARKKNDKKDRIESSSIAFFNRVREGYLTIAKENDDRFTIIDASMGINEIHMKIIDTLNT